MPNPVAGLKALRKIQLAIEGTGTPGTPVTTATARLIGTLGMKMNQKYYRPNDLETGRLSDYERSIIVSTLAELPFNSDANYEQLAYLLNMAIKPGAKTGPTDSQYVYAYDPSLTAANSPNTYTIQYGDDIQAFYSAFCFARSIELSGSLEDAVKVKADLVGDYVRTGTFTALSNPASLSPVVTQTGKLYIDSSWAGLGGTVQAATLVDFTWKLTEGVIPLKYANGDLFYSDRVEKKRHVELDMTLAFNSASYALWANFTASPQTKVWARLEFTGPLIGVTAHDVLTLDGAYIVDDFDTLSEREGQDIVKVKLISQYDPTGTKEWTVTLKNALSALP